MLNVGFDVERFDADKYKRAIEKALAEIPVENGAVTLEALWLETAIPQDIIIEIVRNGGLELPPYVEKIATRDGQVLWERSSAEPQAQSANGDGGGER